LALAILHLGLMAAEFWFRLFCFGCPKKIFRKRSDATTCFAIHEILYANMIDALIYIKTNALSSRGHGQSIWI